MISEHLPDLEVITYHAESGSSPLSEVSPWTKFASLLLLVILVTLSRGIVTNAILFCIVVILYAAAGLPVRRLLAWYLFPLLVVISLAGIMAWSQPGTPFISIGLGGMHVALTDGGVTLLVTLLLKALATFTFTLVILMTTRYEHLAGAIQRIFPDPLDQMILLSYRFVFLSLAMVNSMLKALRSRGGGVIHSMRVSGSMFPEIFAITVLRSLERAERIQKAMRARGYHGEFFTQVGVPSPGLKECAFIALFTTLILAVGMNLFGMGCV